MKPEAIAGWTAAALVLAGILTAWIEPPATGVLHAGVFLLTALWTTAALIRRTPVAIHWLTLLPLACAAWGLLQIALGWNVYPHEGWNAVSAWAARAAIFAAAYIGFRTSARRDRLKSATVWFAGAFSLLAILQWYTGKGAVLWIFQTRHASEIAGTFANRDQYAVLMEILLPVALAAAFGYKRFAPAPAVCAGLVFASVIASASRAGALILCLEALVFLAVACTRHRRDYRAAAWIAASLVLCTLIGGWTYVLERFSLADPFAARRELLIATVDMIRSRPLTGFGLGAWPSAYPAFAVFDPPGIYMNHAHNDWAEWAAEGGLLFTAFPALFAVAVALRSRKHLWAIGIPAAFAHALADFPLQKPALALTIFFFAGVLAAASRPATPTVAPPAEEREGCESLPQ